MHFCHIAASCLLTYTSVAFHTALWFNQQGRNRGDKGGAIPPAPDHSVGTEILRGRRMIVGVPKSPQQCHKHFLQYSTFSSERPQVRTWGCQTCFLPGALFVLVTLLSQEISSVKKLIHSYVARLRCRQTADSRTALATALKLVSRFHFKCF